MTAPDHTPEVHARRARSFGALAEEYERWRPRYPDDAVDWMLPQGAREVADVGAGTGKLTGLLLARGLRVTAVEPDPAMVAVLARVHPTADARQAGADALPLGDASTDAVVVGQAWHWFPHEQAVAEIRRVLRPGGRLGLIWNQVWPAEPWQTEVEALNARARGHEVEIRDELPDVVEVEGLPTEELEAALFPWTELLDVAAVRSRLATYSHVALLADAERDELLERVTTVVSAETTRRGTSTLPFRQVAYCVRWTPSAL
jgi:SAM-dependent methyltransferase